LVLHKIRLRFFLSQTSVIPWMTPEKKGLSISGIKAPTMLLFCRERPFAMALGTN